MTNCIINIVAREVVVQFDELIETGVVIVYNNHNTLLNSFKIVNTNSVSFDLPQNHQRFAIRVLFGKSEIIKKIAVRRNTLIK